MHFFINHSNLPLPNKNSPKRIISLVPSQTELLYTLGMEDYVVGITKFCVHPPEWKHSKTIVGGTKQLHIEKIKALSPDLIIANKEENIREQIETISHIAPVWVTDVNNLDDALSMIHQMGEICYKNELANQLAKNIQNNFSSLKPLQTHKKVVYIIWKQPLMVAASQTFIHEMLLLCGFVNAFQNKLRYPAITEQELIASAPEFILLSSEPYPFQEKHMHYFQQLLPHSTIILVDGEMFSWYGSRLLHSVAYFKTLIENIQKNSQLTFNKNKY
jgi:ABC-type Fe3+-hydroxamate transport system substrate-binding protein